MNFQPNVSPWRQCIPFGAPAVTRGRSGLEIDPFLIFLKMVLCVPVSFLAIRFFETPVNRLVDRVVPILKTSRVKLLFLVFIALNALACLFEYRRAREFVRRSNVSLDEHLVNCFSNHPEQLDSTTISLIYQRPSAVQQLVNEGIDLNKSQPSGSKHIPILSSKRISLDEDCFEAFKILIDNGFDVTANEMFSSIVTASSSKFLRYVIDRGLVTPPKISMPSQLSAFEQVFMFRWIRCLEVIDMLVEIGFDINITDQSGKTALDHLYEEENKRNSNLSLTNYGVSTYQAPSKQDLINHLEKCGGTKTPQRPISKLLPRNAEIRDLN